MLIAHADTAISTVTTSSFPVFGNLITGFIAMLVAIAVFYLIYHFASKYFPTSKRSAWSMDKQVHLGRMTSGLIIIAMMAAAWDIWWHRAVGRDNLFVAPHLLLYTCVGLVVLLCLYGWYKSRNKIWKRIVFFILLVPLSAPFDNYWHILFGVEDLSRPVALAWTPPHVLLDLAALCALLLHIPLFLHEHKQTTRTFFLDILFAAVAGMLSFFVMPFHPTDGWGQIFGFYGAGFMSFFYLIVLSTAQRIMRGEFDFTRITAYLLIFLFISYGKETADFVTLLPHDRPPAWIYVFAFISFGLVLDIFRKIPMVWRGALAASVWALIVFGLSRYFFEPQFYYSTSKVIISTMSSAIGAAAGVICSGGIHKMIKKYIK